MSILITHIKLLVNTREKYSLLRGAALKELPCVEDAWLLVEDKRISGYGSMKDLKYRAADFREHIDATGQIVMPSWCDSHTHIVYAGSRENEFVDKIMGLGYAEIAAKGGGILHSAARLNAVSEDELFNQSYQRLQDVMKLGTGAIEIKSGYGLTVEGELKMLRVIRKLRNTVGIPVKATFLGAHSFPLEFRENRDGYIRLLLEKMLPVIASEKLADYIDVFCEQGFFTPEETVKICEAGKAAGLKAKIHANQLGVSGGVQAGVKAGALSVDHLESMDDEATAVLAESETIGTLLPAAAFFLRMPFQPARQLIEKNCAVALASDYNPGSSPSGNMNFVVALSCIQMKMLPQEALNASTINGAYAMELQDEVGTITKGKLANLILTKQVPSLNYIPYSFGQNLVERVMAAGEWLM